MYAYAKTYHFKHQEMNICEIGLIFHLLVSAKRIESFIQGSYTQGKQYQSSGNEQRNDGKHVYLHKHQVTAVFWEAWESTH